MSWKPGDLFVVEPNGAMGVILAFEGNEYVLACWFEVERANVIPFLSMESQRGYWHEERGTLSEIEKFGQYWRRIA